MCMSLRDWIRSGYSQWVHVAGQREQLCWRIWIICEFTLFHDTFQLGKQKAKQFWVSEVFTCLWTSPFHLEVNKWFPSLSKVKKVPPPPISFCLGKEGIGGEGTPESNWDFFSDHENRSLYNCLVAIRNISVFYSPVMPLRVWVGDSWQLSVAVEVHSPSVLPTDCCSWLCNYLEAHNADWQLLLIKKPSFH